MQKRRFDNAAIETVGAMLVELGFGEPASLRATLEVMPQQLMDAAGDRHAQLLAPRLMRFQAVFASSFYAEARQQASAAQEQNMAALLAARNEAEASLRATEEQLSAITAHVPLVLFTVDRHGIITFVTGRSLDALGLAPEQLVGRSIRQTTRKQPEVVEYVEAALAGEAFTAIVDANDRTFETRYAPYTDETGKIAGVVGVALDVTERTQLQERLVELRQQAGKSLAVALVAQSTADLFPDDLALLRLVSEGQTNRQIGAAVGVSSKAIEKRLTKLFARLGVNSRTEAAAWAARAKLV